jgi:sirohydrochlorin cobaltochelatase
MPSAYLLVSHGSRDPRPEIAMNKLVDLIGESHLPKEKNLIGTAYLELKPTPLHAQIQEFGFQAQAYGCDRLKIVPLFLLPGVHVMTDIPAEVSTAQAGLELAIEVKPYLGTHPGLAQLLKKQMSGIEVQKWILLSHGSRRPGSVEPVEAIAASLGAVAAYWVLLPSLQLQIQELANFGVTEIGILPYFLFAGGITDALAQSVEQSKMQFPAVSLQLAEPLGASSFLADLIWDLLEQ